METYYVIFILLYRTSCMETFHVFFPFRLFIYVLKLQFVGFRGI